MYVSLRRKREKEINKVPSNLPYDSTYYEHEVDVVKCYGAPDVCFIPKRTEACALYKKDFEKQLTQKE